MLWNGLISLLELGVSWKHVEMNRKQGGDDGLQEVGKKMKM